MKQQKRKTNVEIIKGIMEWHGPIVQVFIVEAIANYADKVAKGTPAAYDTALISGAAWVEAAKIVKREMDRQYKN